MAKLCRHLAVFLFLFCVASLIFSSHAANLNFSIPPINDIAFENDAYPQGEKLQLTLNQASGGLNQSFGWAVYNKSVPLWNNSSRALANFSTYFQFVIEPGNNPETDYGDGLAFFLAPFELEPPVAAGGGGLGLFNGTTFNGSFYQMIGVEFDTYSNVWDPSSEHVGIDVNTVLSNATFSLTNSSANYSLCDNTLKNGKQWDAWVDYDGTAKRLQVFLFCNSNSTRVSKPPVPILSHDIDLRISLPPMETSTG